MKKKRVGKQVIAGLLSAALVMGNGGVPVQALDDTAAQFQQDVEALTIHNLEDVRGNLTLPLTTEHGATVTWTSSNEEVIISEATGNNGEKPAGVVNRPADADTTVTLTATITDGENSDTKEFQATVRKASGITEQDYAGYLYAYFTNNSIAGEKIYFASSSDGFHFNVLNDGFPVLESVLGEQGLRDPFLMRSPEGDKFYLIATDLSIGRNSNWTRAQEEGSNSIMVWESSDLVNWSDQRMVEISASLEAGCTWAPEFIYDEATGEYLVFWASKVASDSYAKQRIYYSRTRDFYTFTEPQVYIEKDDFPIIDTTIVKYNGRYYRISKNENSKHVFMEVGDSLLGEFTTVDAPILTGQSNVEGPELYRINGTDQWCAILDNFNDKGYYPLLTEDLAGGEFRVLDQSEYSFPKARHGCVVSLTAEELEGVQTAYQSTVDTSGAIDMNTLISNGTVTLTDSTPNRDEASTKTQALYLFDQDNANTSDFRGEGNGYGWVVFDFGRKGSVSLTKAAILARQDQLGRIKGAVIQGSNDKETWVDLTPPAVEPQEKEWQELEAINTEYYRYLRFYNNANWYGNAAELALYGDVIFSDYQKITLDSTMVTGSTPWNNSSNTAAKTVDGDYNTFFDGLAEGYVTIDLGRKYTLEALAYVPRSGYESRMQGGVFYGSEDGEEWASLYQVTETPAFARTLVDASRFEDGKAGQGHYRYVKYLGADYCNIAEIELYGEEYEEVITEGFVNLDRTGWTASTNSYANSSNGADKVLDGSQSTHWHSSWDSTQMANFDKVDNPYYLQIDRSNQTEFSRFCYLPRAFSDAGSVNGVVIQYELLGSDDGSSWTKFAEGNWPYDYSIGNHSERTATFDPVTYRYVRMVVRDNACRQDQTPAYYASAGEINMATYLGNDAEFPLTVEKQKLAECIQELEALEDSTIKNRLLSSAEALRDNPCVVAEDIALFRENAVTVIDLQKWMTGGVNANYFSRLMNLLDENDYSISSVNKVSSYLDGFYTKGKDISENLKIDFAEEYYMSEEDQEKPLIDRLTETVNRAKAYIDGNPNRKCTMLKELVSYVDDTYQNDGGFRYPNGLDASTCEYVVNNMNYALRNLEQIDAGTLSTAMDTVQSGKPWLDTEGSKISAHGGQIIKVDDTYYWYGEDNKVSYATRTGVSCYSSKDLKNWTYEGLAFRAFDTELNPKFAEEFITDDITGTQGRIERPKVIYNERTGKYVMWMHLEKNGGYGLSLAGVAISDNPTHGFRWLHYGYPVYDKSVTYDGKQRQTYRDMNLFVDEDGTAYTIFSSEENKTMYIVQLNEDYTWINTDGMTVYSPEDDIPYNTDASDDIEDGTVVYEGLAYADTTVRAVGSYNYKLPSFTGEQMKYDRSELKNAEGRWSRAFHYGTSGTDNMREAPAPVKIGDTYILITSGCSGWNANKVRAESAPEFLGPYTKQSNSMMSGDGDYNPYGQYTCNGNTAFDSQSTCVLQLPDGGYMYMGDRWKDGDFNDASGGSAGSLVKRSTYVWLPITVSDTGILDVQWQDAWEINSGTDYEKGDVNRDGGISTTDVLLALQCASGEAEVTESGLELADMNNDNKITSVDALLILKKTVGAQ